MRSSTLRIIGGPFTAMIVYILLPEGAWVSDGREVVLTSQGRIAIAAASWMAFWWMTEAIPVAATALLPLIAFPLFGLMPINVLSASYAHPLIFLFLGGFLVSIAIEKWSLHSWVSRRVIRLAGTNPRHIVGAFMLVSAAASMWISNTATAIMMLPIAVAVIATVEGSEGESEHTAFARCLMLGIAYGASLGGTATLIGSPPNLFVASYLQEHFDLTISFAEWMLVASPVVVIMLPLTWVLLTRWLMPLSDIKADGAVLATPPRWRDLPTAAHRVAFIFMLLVLAWVTRPYLVGMHWAGWTPFVHLNDTVIALAGGVSLFIVSSGEAEDRLLTWADAARLPFGTLILFGGGLALAATIVTTGADEFIGAQLSALRQVPSWVTVLAVVSGIVFLTEMTSNTATTTTLAPILAAAAAFMAFDVSALLIVTALAASAAFMMPVATPPNAIVYGGGRLPVATMIRCGLAMNVLAIVFITCMALWWVPRMVPN